MTPDEAYHVLQLEPGAKREQIEQHFQEQHEVLRARRAHAPSPGQKAHIQQNLVRLAMARDALLQREDAAEGPARRRGGPNAVTSAEVEIPPVTAADVAAAVDALPRRLNRHADGLFRALVATLAGGLAGWSPGLVSAGIASQRSMWVGGGLVVGGMVGVDWWRSVACRLRREEWVKVREALERRESRPVTWRRQVIRLSALLLLLLAFGVSVRRGAGRIAVAPSEDPLAVGFARGEVEIDRTSPGAGGGDRPGPTTPGTSIPAAEEIRSDPSQASPATGPQMTTASPLASDQGSHATSGDSAPLSPLVESKQAASPREAGSASGAASAVGLAERPETLPATGDDPGTGAEISDERGQPKESRVSLARSNPPGLSGNDEAGTVSRGGATEPAAPRSPAMSAGHRADGAEAGPTGLQEAAVGEGTRDPLPPLGREVPVGSEAGRARSPASGVARADRAQAIRARAETLRVERRPGLALYVLHDAEAGGIAGASEFAAMLRREFAEANPLAVWLAPPEVRAGDARDAGESAVLGTLGADLAATLHAGLALAVPGIVTFAGGQRAAEPKPAAMPQLVLRVDLDPVSGADPVGSASTQPGPPPTATPVQPRSLRISVGWDDGTDGARPTILLQLSATVGSPADAASAALVRGDEAILTALRTDLRGQLRARMPELLAAFAEASLEVLRERRAAEDAEAPPGDLEWGWFAVWAEAGLTLPQVDAEQAARRALALPEAQPVEGS